MLVPGISCHLIRIHKSRQRLYINFIVRKHITIVKHLFIMLGAILKVCTMAKSLHIKNKIKNSVNKIKL